MIKIATWNRIKGRKEILKKEACMEENEILRITDGRERMDRRIDNDKQRRRTKQE
jgi:hypothetical protein